MIRLATTDPLTGVCNRRAFFEEAEKACQRAGNGAALGHDVDIDHFKAVNDSYGHDVGDEALRGLTRAVTIGNAVVGRLGGEEFAILLEDIALPEAVTLAGEHLRKKIAALRFEVPPKFMTLTCSFGVGEWRRGDTIDTLLQRADMALYEAKTAGATGSWPPTRSCRICGYAIPAMSFVRSASERSSG